MATFHDLTTAQLKRAVQMREQIESLREKLDALLGGRTTKETKRKVGRPAGKRVMSAAGRAKIAAAQQARWAQIKEKSPTKKPAPAKASIKMVAKKKGGITAAGRAKLAAAMRARWAAKKGAMGSEASAK